jgi:hypothetical protein
VTTTTDAVLAAIDSAVEDWQGSPDAARWHADGGPDKLGAGVSIDDFTAGLEAIAAFGRTMQASMSQIAAALVQAAKPISEMGTRLAAELAHAQDVRERPRWHRIRCRRCNPAGNPLGDPVGRGYHRRQMARRRRRRR